MIKKISFVVLLSINAILYAQNTKELMKNMVSEYTYPTKTVEIDSLEISYVKEGKGTTTLLFLHGLSSNADAWSKNIESLKNSFTCIAIDLPGYGKSSKLKVDYTPAYFAKITHQFIMQLDLKNVVLIGHSMGGQAAIKLTTKYPNDIEKLILVAPAGLETFSEAQANFMKAAYTTSVVKNTSDEQIATNYALNFYKLPAAAQKMIDDRKHIRNASDFNAHCEAIVKSIAGMLDEPVFNELKNIAKEKIKNVQLKFIQESGHFVQFEKPNEVNLLISKFAK